MHVARSRILTQTCVFTLAVLGTSILSVSFHVEAQEKSPPACTPSPSAATPIAPTLAVPSPEALLLLARTTTIAIDQANKTGNYSVLHALGGPGLQAYSIAQLAKTFE